MWLHTCFHERTFVERQTYEVLIEKDRLFYDSDSDDFDSGLQIYVSVGSRIVGFVLKFRNPNMFTPIRNTRYA